MCTAEHVLRDESDEGTELKPAITLDEARMRIVLYLVLLAHRSAESPL